MKVCVAAEIFDLRSVAPEICGMAHVEWLVEVAHHMDEYFKGEL